MVMKVGWLVDFGAPVAGMVLQVRAYEAAKPKGIELVKCKPNRRPPSDIDAYILHGDLYPREWIEIFEQKPLMAHRHGGWFAGDTIFRRWVLDNADLVTFNSPKQRELFKYPVQAKWAYIPTPIDIDKFREAADKVEERTGTIYLGLLAPVKGIAHTIDWGLCYNHPIDFYGKALYPSFIKAIVPPCVYKGPVPYEQIPDLLAQYENYIFMPYDGDLYSRTTIEAWASGCTMILDGDQKAFYDYLDADQCRNGGKIFWETFEEMMNG